MAIRLIPLATTSAPIAVAGPGTEGQLYLADQNGLITTYLSGSTSVFLDLRSQIPPLNPEYDERGLLDLVMSPQKDRLFVFYTSLGGRNRLAEIDLRSRTVTPLLNILERSDIHNGGRMAFGPDGYLYLGLGDGGGQGDPRGNAQNLSSLLGKVLRLDVARPGGYRVPPDNPFVGYPGLRPEIYAYGFRNPWGLTFNQNGVGYVTDAGYNSWEEVNILRKGGNYGWNIKEGTSFTDLPRGTSGGTHLPGTEPDRNQPFVDPIYEYPTKRPGEIPVQTSSIVGGGFFPDGTYVFGDYGGVIMQLSPNHQLVGVQRTPDYIRAFSQDLNGNIYLMTSDQSGPVGSGQISRLIREN